MTDKANTAMRASYTYNDDGSLKTESKGGKVTAAYTYDAIGRRASKTVNGGKQRTDGTEAT